MPLQNYLEWMKRKGSSVILNWGEDDDAWECSWITSGIRYTGISMISPLAAVLMSLQKANALKDCNADVASRSEVMK